MNMLLLQGFEAFCTGNTMKNLRRFITALVLTVAFVLCSKFTSHATANILPLSTPAWFDAEYYAATYPEVHALYGTGALDSGFDATMWFHYRNFERRCINSGLDSCGVTVSRIVYSYNGL